MDKHPQNHSIRPIIWSIAGSDCSGGAGIQADIKTAHTLGCEICTLITANTVQNAKNLIAIHPVEIDTLQSQLDCLLSDKPPVAIKIGLIANNAQLQWLVASLTMLKQNRPGLVIVLDPVMKASVGKDLTAEPIKAAWLDKLLGLINIVTPNIAEALRLANSTQNPACTKQLANAIINKGCQNVIITGGHSQDPTQVIDECFAEQRHLKLCSPRVNTSYGHGSGCSFATALTSFLAHSQTLQDAFIQTKAFIHKGFSLCASHKGYYGALIQPSWPVEQHYYPKVLTPTVDKVDNKIHYPSLGVKKLGLYPVVDSIELLKKLLPLGLEIIQLRLKNHSLQTCDSLIQQAVKLSQNYSTRLFINDYWSLAIKHGAYGVHLGQEDLEEADLTAISQAGLRLGISTHGAYELKFAESIQPSYIAIGAIFPTQTKDMTGQIQGIENLKALVNLQTELPIIAIGGITLNNVDKVINTGVDGFAVVTEITLSEHPDKVVTQFKQRFNSHQNVPAKS